MALLALGDLLPLALESGLGLLVAVSRGVSWVSLSCSLSLSSLSSLSLLLLLPLLLLPLAHTGRRCRKPISSSRPASALLRLVGNYTGSRLQIYLLSRTIRTVVYVGPQIRFIRTTYLFILGRTILMTNWY